MKVVSYNAGVKFRTVENTLRLGLSMGSKSVVFLLISMNLVSDNAGVKFRTAENTLR
jgi:hypothetical protein